MRELVPVIFAQAADSIPPDALRGMDWPGVLLIGLGGSGGIVALVKYIAQPLAEHLKAKRERETAERAEEQAQRKERHTAELDQIRVVTSLAQSVSPALDKLATEIKTDREVIIREMRVDREMHREEMRTGFAQMHTALVPLTRAVDANTQAVDAMSGHVYSKNQDTLEAIAEHVGAQKATRALDDGPRSTGVRPRLPSNPR